MDEPKQSASGCNSEEAQRQARSFFTTLNLIANKWTIRLVYSLLHAERRTLRFGALQKAMDGISQRELTKHLREFERVGLVERKAYAEIPPRVEYTLTPLGATLCTPIEALSNWSLEHGVHIEKARVPQSSF